MSGGIDIKSVIGLPDDVSVLRTWLHSRDLSSTKFITEDQSAAILEAVKTDEWVSQAEFLTADLLLLVVANERVKVTESYREGKVPDEVMKNFDTMVDRAKTLYAKMEEAAVGYIAEQEGLQPAQESED
jgi:hypothetical protein